MSNGVQGTNAAAPAQQLEKTVKTAGQEAIDNLRTVRNVAAGVCAASVAAMGAEALGVVTIPAAIPTGLLAITSGGLAVVTGMIVGIGEGVNNLIEKSGSREEQLKKAMQD